MKFRRFLRFDCLYAPPFNSDNIMYNFQLNNKKRKQQQGQRLKSISLQKFANNYYQRKQPQLLNNYNKRVNDFIRRIQHQPIVVKLDPYQTTQPTEKIKQNKSKNHLLRRVSGKTGIHQKSDVSQEELNHQVFKYKNSEDWTSLFTPWQRLQRQKNYQIFKTKYGDPNLAYRSIGSQSQYHPHHQYRQRNQNLQINPPMKYTSKPTEQILAQIKSKTRKKQKDLKQLGVNKTFDLKGTTQWDKHLISSSSHSVLGVDELSNQNITNQHAGSQGKGRQNELEQSQPGNKKQSKFKQRKSYFKQIIDIEQNMQDEKSKKLLKNILQKCGIYRKKNRRVVTDNDVDQFQKLERVSQY